MIRLCLSFVIFAGFLASPTSAVGAGRDPFRQPFNSQSIWNMPIGSGAQYQYVGFQPAEWATIDEDYIFETKDSDPLRWVIAPKDWGNRCGGTEDQGLRIPVPDSLIVPDARPGKTPNNCAAFLMPDRRTIVQLNPLARCDIGGPLYGWVAPTVDIYGPGIEGGHGGSGLSSIGGTIRRGELTGPDQIRHALKVNVWGKKYLYAFGESDSGYTWPAWRHDGCAPECYGGQDPLVRMGSLLAIPPNVTLEMLQLETESGRKLFWTLQNYGAYIADDTAWNAYAIEIEHGVKEEFQRTYRTPMENTRGTWYNDYMKLFRFLAVVTNSGPQQIGGGGQPRQPLAPELAPPSHP